jgi:hypothetical protein
VILDHAISFEVPIEATPDDAVAFVRDVPRSLAEARFLRGLRVLHGATVVVEASLPINAALFGQRELPFRSMLSHTPHGARLEALPLEGAARGWAEVGGEAIVTPVGDGSLIRYDLTITVHVALPEADRWGTRALTKMIEYTASTILASVAAAFPAAVARAAREAEHDAGVAALAVASD